MTTAVKIPDLATIHKPYGEAVRKAEKAQKQLDDLTRAAREANRDGYGSYEHGQIAKGQELQADLRGAESDVKLEGQEARSLARAAIEADPAYRQVVADAVAALVARVAPLLAYETVVHDAGLKAITLTPLPASVAAELRELRAWIATLLRMGLVDIDKVPSSLRPPIVEALP